MTPDNFPEQAAALCEVGRAFGHRQWLQATSGNLSLRIDEEHFLITQSGTDKSKLNSGDLMVCDMRGEAWDSTLRPSAETPMHALLYRRDKGIESVLHTHSVAVTLLSKSSTHDLELWGYEMQKALAGCESHNEKLTIPVFDNNQDMEALAAAVGARLDKTPSPVPGFMVRGHGLYAWGDSLAQAKRHAEGLEFLASCLWQEKLAGSHEG